MKSARSAQASVIKFPREAASPHEVMLSEAAKLPAMITLFGLAYAILRYHYFGGVSLDHFPLYILNKAISVGGLVFLVMSRTHQDPLVRKYRGLVGFVLTALHLVLSLPILQPAYFEKLFLQSGTMNWRGELTILTGIIGFALVCWLLAATLFNDTREANDRRAARRVPRPMPRFVTKAALLMTALHVGALGYSKWLSPFQWLGHMPPITLLCFVLAVVGFFWSKRRSAKRVKTRGGHLIPLRATSK